MKHRPKHLNEELRQPGAVEADDHRIELTPIDTCATATPVTYHPAEADYSLHEQIG